MVSSEGSVVVKVHPVGIRRESIPIPPVDEVTRYVEAGVLKLGLEYRVVTEEMLREHYGDDTSSAQLLDDALAGTGQTLEDQGFSLHVFHGSREYLRFDDFGDNPHYHYITPGSHHYVVAHDGIANGSLLGWAIGVLRERAGPMLRNAGATEAADALDIEALHAALDRVEAMWKEATSR